MPWGSTHWELWICTQNSHNSARFTKNLTVRNSSAPYPIGPFVPKGIVANFTEETIAQAAVLDTSVSNVASFIQPIGVIFVPQSLPLVCNWSLQNRKLPTPIQTDKLQPLLDGYDVGLTSILCNGFRFGFSLHFEGS